MSRQLNCCYRSLVQRAILKIRKSLTILAVSLAFFLSSTRVIHPPAHAASPTASITTKSSSPPSSLVKRLNPFRTRSADELIDQYVRDRLFANDEYDPVESAYREAVADAQSSTSDGSSPAGAYPTLLAETARAALGRKDVSIISSAAQHQAGSSASDSSQSNANQGITGALIKASDFLQKRCGVSASVSYYMIAAGGLLGGSVLPGTIGVAYQAFQRLQIDKSEMKMYGKIADMDATAKKVTEEDGDDDDDDEE
eukprot:scaffold570_cov169-Alexandrium_tamarense.AAC.19